MWRKSPGPLTCPPSGLGTKKRGQNVLGVVEVGSRLPSALVHIVTAQPDQVLEATATHARPQNTVNFVLNGGVRKVERGRNGRKSVIRVRVVRPEETRVQGVVDIAVRLGEDPGGK